MIRKTNRRGISLIELVLTLAIMVIVIQVIYSIFFVSQKSYTTSQNIGFAQQEARNPLNFIDRELRSAKFIYLNHEPEEYPYYKLFLQDNKLIKQTYITVDNVNEQSYFSGISNMSYHPIWIDKANDDIEYNMLDLVIESEEESIKKTYTMSVRFENNTETGAIQRPSDEENNLIELAESYDYIYYTKFE